MSASMKQTHNFRYTHQVWEVIVMICFIVPCVFFIRIIALFNSSLWIVIPLICLGLLSPYLIIRLFPAKFSLQGSAIINEQEVLFNLQFRKIKLSWDEVKYVRYWKLKENDTDKNRGLIIRTNGIKGINIYPVDQSLDVLHESIMREYS